MLQPIVPLSEDLKMVRILQYVPTQLCVCVEEGWKGAGGGGGVKWGGLEMDPGIYIIYMWMLVCICACVAWWCIAFTA